MTTEADAAYASLLREVYEIQDELDSYSLSVHSKSIYINMMQRCKILYKTYGQAQEAANMLVKCAKVFRNNTKDGARFYKLYKAYLLAKKYTKARRHLIIDITVSKWSNIIPKYVFKMFSRAYILASDRIPVENLIQYVDANSADDDRISVARLTILAGMLVTESAGGSAGSAQTTSNAKDSVDELIHNIFRDVANRLAIDYPDEAVDGNGVGVRQQMVEEVFSQTTVAVDHKRIRQLVKTIGVLILSKAKLPYIDAYKLYTMLIKVCGIYDVKHSHDLNHMLLWILAEYVEYINCVKPCTKLFKLTHLIRKYGYDKYCSSGERSFLVVSNHLIFMPGGIGCLQAGEHFKMLAEHHAV